MPRLTVSVSKALGTSWPRSVAELVHDGVMWGRLLIAQCARRQRRCRIPREGYNLQRPAPKGLL